jgi:hypothetical protein
MSVPASFSELTDLLRPVLKEGVCADLTTKGCDVLALSARARHYRVFLFHLLWEKGRTAPVRVRDILKELSPYQKSTARRSGESWVQHRQRLAENFHSSRRRINEELAVRGIPCHMALERLGTYSDLGQDNGVLLLLDPLHVAEARRSEGLQRIARVRGRTREVMMQLVPTGGAPHIGSTLCVQLSSPLSGWLNLLAYFPGGSLVLIPQEGMAPVRIVARRMYGLPEAIYPAAEWQLRGASGPHVLVAIVTRSPQHIELPDGLEVRQRLCCTRGIVLRRRSLWSIPEKDMAVGMLQLDVAPSSGKC